MSSSDRAASLFPSSNVFRLCQVLEVSSSGYYDWCDRPESHRTKEKRRLLTKISLFHKANCEIYGSPRIRQDLVDADEVGGIHRVARLMQKNGIQSKMARKFVITTHSKNTMQPVPDQLKRQFKVDTPDKAWVSDTTFIRLALSGSDHRTLLSPGNRLRHE